MVCISFDLGLLVGVPLQGQVIQSLQVGLYVVFEEDLEWVVVVPHLSVFGGVVCIGPGITLS